MVGAAIGVFLPTSNRVVGLIMGFGTGVLISALAFELTLEAFHRGGGYGVVLGLLAGAIVFYVGDLVIDRHGGHRRKSPKGTQAGAGAMTLVLGALLDGIPESAAIGVSLLGGGAVGVAVVVAVFLSNVPESLSASTGMQKSGHSKTYIFVLWGIITLASAASAALGYAVLGNTSDTTVAVTQAFAAGAILTMLSDTMVPEAVEHAGATVGLVTVLGFVAAFMLSMA
jgi:ZIP family zinc transporter